MVKINSFKELKEHKSRLSEHKPAEWRIFTCAGTGCAASDSIFLAENFRKIIAEKNLQDRIQVIPTGCFGFCEKGPIVNIFPDDTFYVKVSPDDADDIVNQHILNGQVVDRLLYIDPQTGEKHAQQHNIGFYQNQMRVALRNCGKINPEQIDDYISHDGYFALGKALFEMSPEAVIEEVKKSGLRGRGGGGFPTGVKWEATRKSESDKKYIVCNADEGDPGAFMDRSLMEGDPHAVIEAMAIAGHAIGADEGLVYIRAEYPLAVHRLKTAISQAFSYGMLGNNIMGSGFNFKVRMSLGAGAFVCGEETSLMNSVQGERGEPRVKPPFPAQHGIWNQPTNINNVETYANIPQIILKGADWFSSIGTEKSKGTKVFALAGKINNVGLAEVPMGTPLRDVIFGIGGGIRDGKKLKAVQTGGPSGGCIPADELDLPIDYENLQSIGSMMGSGGMIVMDETDCMVDVAKFYLEFTVGESCGKCTPCRIGNLRLHELLEKISNGHGTMDDLKSLRELGEVIRDTSLCGLGQTSPNPVLSTMNYFGDEYEAHVKERRCPAGKCTSLLRYQISPEKCTGCTVCAKNCPVPCIEGERKVTHRIIQEKCIKCGVCYSKCPFGAISKV
ncbi:MAG: NADH-quinone oxidoreductase subunit NuoF [Clostridiales bacterium]|jgi:NADH-quinone oxidoreductase subunit F/NADP-reducing hydrogenase subunit HndC|nr:NADH-quinone oxidoreductase subunit NuoF [Clostridiales bacterium]